MRKDFNVCSSVGLKHFILLDYDNVPLNNVIKEITSVKYPYGFAVFENKIKPDFYHVISLNLISQKVFKNLFKNNFKKVDKYFKRILEYRLNNLPKERQYLTLSFQNYVFRCFVFSSTRVKIESVLLNFLKVLNVDISVFADYSHINYANYNLTFEVFERDVKKHYCEVFKMGVKKL
jgi:hypothetical protein